MLATLYARRIRSARRRRSISRMGRRASVAVADWRTRTLRTRGRSRSSPIPGRDGAFREFDATTARADLGSTRYPARASEVRISNRQRDSADVGACGIYQAAALGLGEPR